MASLARAMTRSSHARPHWLLLACTFAFACPADDTVPSDGGGTGSTAAAASTAAADSTHGVTSTSGAPGSSSSSTDPTAADSTGDPSSPRACLCEWPNQLGSGCSAEALAEWVPDCPATQPCPRLTVECSRPGVDLYDCTAALAFDERAMQCMLEVLRDGTPARLEIDGLEDGGIFSGQSLYLVHVVPTVTDDRLALRTGCRQTDLGAQPYGPSPFFLADADYFTACMGVTAPRERYDCMMNGLVAEAPCEVAQAVPPAHAQPG